jgi:hypothetical protein
MGKLVSAEYQEIQKTRSALDKVDDPIAKIAEQFVTPARIDKAIAHLIEQGNDHYEPHHIIAEISKDVKKEESDLIKEQLFKAYWGQIGRRIAQDVLDMYQPERVG